MRVSHSYKAKYFMWFLPWEAVQTSWSLIDISFIKCKMDLREVGCDLGDWIDLSEDVV